MARPQNSMIDISGYNSLNSNHFASMCREYTLAYHIKDTVCIDATNRRGVLQGRSRYDRAPSRIRRSSSNSGTQ